MKNRYLQFVSFLVLACNFLLISCNKQDTTLDERKTKYISYQFANLTDKDYFVEIIVIRDSLQSDTIRELISPDHTHTWTWSETRRVKDFDYDEDKNTFYMSLPIKYRRFAPDKFSGISLLSGDIVNREDYNSLPKEWWINTYLRSDLPIHRESVEGMRFAY